MHGPPTVSLAGDGTIFSVAAHRETITTAFRSTGPIAIDLSGIGPVDISFVQLLVAVRKSAAHHDRSLTISGLPDTLRSACERCGLGLEAIAGSLPF